MNAVNKSFVKAALLSTLFIPPYSASAQYFSSTGRAGHYAEFFLESMQDSGIQENKIANVIISTNEALRIEKEYLINCNRLMPQVINDNDVSKSIDVGGEPSNADKIEWELWFAVCKNEFAKVSKRSPIDDQLMGLNDIEDFNFDSLPYKITYRSLDYTNRLSNLVDASFDRTDGKRVNPILIYCERDNPTVHWTEFGQLVGVNEATAIDLNQGVEERLVSLSAEIWSKTCNQVSNSRMAGHGLREVKVTEAPLLKMPVKTEPKDEIKQSKEVSSIADIYRNYILAKEACHYHYAGERQILSVKSKLSKLDALSIKHEIDTEKIWNDAVGFMKNDANYKLMQLYKVMPLEASDRIHFTQSCEQFTSLLGVVIDDHMQKYGGETITIEKDF